MAHVALNRLNQTKHEHLVEELRARVQDAPVGTMLPAERALAEEFGVARMTIRQALDALERNGEVERRRGAGTFTARPKLDQSLRITSFTEEMRRLGMSASSVSLGGSRILAGARIGAKLRVSPDAEVWNIGRLRLADREPMAIEWVTIPAELVPGVELADFQRDSLYKVLQERFDVRLTGGQQRMEATVTDEEESELLKVPLHSPALFVDRVIWDETERIVEHVRAIYRGDRYAFTADLHLEPRQR